MVRFVSHVLVRKSYLDMILFFCRDYDYPEFTKDETGSYIGSLRSPVLGGGGGGGTPLPTTPITSRKSSDNQPR